MSEITAIPIDSIRFEDVQEFCRHQTPEHQRLEYKRQFSTQNRTRQIAKEIAAFANVQGGMILYGVEEEADRRPKPIPGGWDLGSDPRSTVIQTCAHHVFPPITPEVSDFLPNPEDRNKGFLVIRVSASVDVHSVDGNTGFYIRSVDKSETVRANRDMLEHLLLRRQSAVTLQEKRRGHAIEQLTNAVKAEVCGAFWVSIGPRISVAPLIDVHDLRDRASEFSVRSEHFDFCTPFDRAIPLIGVLDGIYALDACGELGGLIDMFGNVTTYGQLSRPCQLDSRIEASVRDRCGNRGVEARLVAERLIATFRSARLVYRAAGFIGLLTARVIASHVRYVPLTIQNERGVAQLLGDCPVDDSIELEVQLETSNLKDDDTIVDTLAPVVDRLLWAWGNTDDGIRQPIMDLAEQAHFGFGKCPNDNYMKPNNRDSCRRCRQAAKNT